VSSHQSCSFFINGRCEDVGYQNVRDNLRCKEYKHFVEQLWNRFYHLSDPHFREDARNHFLQRFWEMYLGVTLLEKDFNLQRHGSEGPEFYASVGDRRVWFEAIAPGPGGGPDQVPQPIDGEANDVPIERILLRFTNALAEKRRRYSAALGKGIIAPEDHYVLAINSKGIIPYDFRGNFIPYYVQAFLPFGPLAVRIDPKTSEVKDSFHQYRPAVSKLSGSSVSTRTFLDEEASFCSAVLHSSVDCANYPNQLGGDFSILHNPNAHCPLDTKLFQWCEQFTFQDNQLHTFIPTPEDKTK
jgi:hypothetical protein